MTIPIIKNAPLTVYDQSTPLEPTVTVTTTLGEEANDAFSDQTISDTTTLTMPIAVFADTNVADSTDILLSLTSEVDLNSNVM